MFETVCPDDWISGFKCQVWAVDLSPEQCSHKPTVSHLTPGETHEWDVWISLATHWCKKTQKNPKLNKTKNNNSKKKNYIWCRKNIQNKERGLLRIFLDLQVKMISLQQRFSFLFFLSWKVCEVTPDVTADLRTSSHSDLWTSTIFLWQDIRWVTTNSNINIHISVIPIINLCCCCV